MDDDANKPADQTSLNQVQPGPTDPNSTPQTPPSEKATQAKAAFFSALELLALVFWVLAEKFREPWIIHWILLSTAVTWFLLGAGHALKIARPKSRAVWPGAWLAVCIFWTLFFVGIRAEAMKKPELNAILNLPQYPQFETSLTDTRLRMETLEELQFKAGQTNLPILGHLLVPASADDAPVVFRFRVVNVGGGVCDGFNLRFACSSNLEISAAPDWSLGPTANATYDLRAFHISPVAQT